MPPLYIEDLARMVCRNPHCTEDHTGQPLVLRSPCHREDGLLAVFEPGADHLHLVCQTCERNIATIAVATHMNPLRRQ
jgi:hypothetical protein